MKIIVYSEYFIWFKLKNFVVLSVLIYLLNFEEDGGGENKLVK